MKRIILPILSLVLVVAFLVVASDAQYATKIYRHANGDQMTVDTGGLFSCAENTLAVQGRTLAIGHSFDALAGSVILVTMDSVDIDDYCVASINGACTSPILSVIPYSGTVAINLEADCLIDAVSATVMVWGD